LDNLNTKAFSKHCHTQNHKKRLLDGAVLHDGKRVHRKTTGLTNASQQQRQLQERDVGAQEQLQDRNMGRTVMMMT
jgi:hypothetical protein